MSRVFITWRSCSAIPLYEQALSLAEANGLVSVQTHVLTQLGKLAARFGRADMALEWYDRAAAAAQGTRVLLRAVMHALLS